MTVPQPYTPSFPLGRRYRYGFQGQEEDNEVWQGAVAFKYRVEDARLGRFFSVDPLFIKYPYFSTFQFSGNRIIDMVEFEGLEPAEPGSRGDIQEAPMAGDINNNRLWKSNGTEWEDQGPVLPTVDKTDDRPNADQAWYNFIRSISSKQYEELINQIYHSKLEPYLVPKGLNVGYYGMDQHGRIMVPAFIKDRLYQEARREAMPALKSAWAESICDCDANSLNPLERISYLSTRARAVSGQKEGWEIIEQASIELASTWLARVSISSRVFNSANRIELYSLGIRGWTEHGMRRFVERSFTESAVLKIVSEGEIELVRHRGKLQYVYSLGKYKVVVGAEGRNTNRIINVMGDESEIINDVIGPFTGF